MRPPRIIARHRLLDLGAADLRARIAAWDRPALLGGGAQFGPAGRWSILAAHPRRVVEAGSDPTFVGCSGGYFSYANCGALESLGAALAEFGLDRATAGLDPELPFQGGLIGFLSYDLAPQIEPVEPRHFLTSRLPLLRFGLYDTFVLVDHATEAATLWAVDLFGEGEAAVLGRLDDWSARLQVTPAGRLNDQDSSPVRPEQSPARFRARVERAKRYIEAGDIFQVNLSQRFATTGRIDPVALDARLRAISPAPYSASLLWDNFAILSASPELFYEVRDRRIVTRPIKGTRPRAVDPARDAAHVADLLASPKDAAELTMIIDLERNDLGRVCEFGSVRVVDPRSVESYPNVHHTVATVAGTLRAEIGPVDVIRALFPGGSITGAPKIRAMQIIAELEPRRRGVYTGSIGYFSANGRSAFNIAIRTIVVEGDRASYHVGGGIVADSDAEREYQETLDKGRLLFQALNLPEAEP